MRRPLRRRMARCRPWVFALAAFAPLACRKGERPASEPPVRVIKTQSGIEMVVIPAGWFRMGSPKGRPDESPAHRVWVASFLIDRYEVTQKAYGRLVLGNPSHFKGSQRPAEQITWAAAALYCNKRSRADDLVSCYDEETATCNPDASGYRLPTEAEWEYACRAGATGAYHFGDRARLLAEHAWYKSNSSKATHPVGQKEPNRWLLFDMHGNVAEWCNDVYEKTYYSRSPSRNPLGPAEGERYVLRGGAWNCTADACRSAYRAQEGPGFEDACFARDAIGFRCVRRAPRAGDEGSRPVPTR